MIDTSTFELVDDEIGLIDTEDDRSRLSFINEAYNFVNRHRWCVNIKHTYLCDVWDGILAILFIEIEPISVNTDDSFWVIVGDLPPAYLDILTISTKREALQVYIEILEEWADAVYAGKSVEDLMPIFVRDSARLIEPNMEHAEMIRKRTDLIREHIMPEIDLPWDEREE